MCVNNTFKRIGAFIFDFLLVSFIVTIFSEFRIINPYFDSYNSVSEQYIEYINSVSLDSNIESSVVNNYLYQISYYSTYINIIMIVFQFIYYCIFQYFNDGKTIGKALMRIKVVSNDGKRVKFYQLLIRTFIINGMLITCLNVVSLFIFSKEVCLEVLPLIQFADTLIMFVCLLMLLFRKDGRSLHDLVSGSKIKEEKIILVDKV